MTDEELQRCKRLRKQAEHYNFGTTAELHGNMRFLLDVLARTEMEREKLWRENIAMRGQLSIPIDGKPYS